MTSQNRAGTATGASAAEKTRKGPGRQQAAAAPAQGSIFEDAAAERERVAAEIASRFSCYGIGTETGNNPIARTLKDQPTTFGFGTPVRAVVDAVCDLVGALPIVSGGDA
jgi:hypothetical protein